MRQGLRARRVSAALVASSELLHDRFCQGELSEEEVERTVSKVSKVERLEIVREDNSTLPMFLIRNLNDSSLSTPTHVLPSLSRFRRWSSKTLASLDSSGGSSDLMRMPWSLRDSSMSKSGARGLNPEVAMKGTLWSKLPWG